MNDWKPPPAQMHIKIHKTWFWYKVSVDNESDPASGTEKRFYGINLDKVTDKVYKIARDMAKEWNDKL